MQTTLASSICPLCKSPAGTQANSAALPSRLCDECRAMLSTILPQAVAGSVVIVDAQKPSTQSLVTPQQIAIAETDEQPVESQPAMPFETQTQAAEIIAEPAFQPEAQDHTESSAFAPSPEPVYFQTEEEFEPSSAPVQEASETFFIQEEEKFEEAYLQAEAKSPYSIREAEFAEPPPTPAISFEQLEKAPEQPPPSENFFAPGVANPFIVQENFQTQEAAPIYPQEAAPNYPQEVAPNYPQEVAPLSPQDAAPQYFYAPEAAPPYPQESVYQASQPGIEDVPPDWDNAMDNYPVLMVQEEKRSLLKPLLALAAMALLALAAAGYWFVYKPYFGGTTSSATQRAGADLEDHSQPTQPEKPAANSAAPPQQETPAMTSPSPTTQSATEDKPATQEDAPPQLEGQNGQGKYSLQAASFPSEQAAKEFAEKLNRSGVPTYIVSADLAGKGKWFRVRVGRFVNAADAEKYATQAKQRTKATGLNLQLVICEYSNQ